MSILNGYHGGLARAVACALVASAALVLMATSAGAAVAAAKAAPAARAPAAAPQSLYERISARLSHDPALVERLGKPSAEIQAMAWMIGTWDITATVFATATAPETIAHGTAVNSWTLAGTWIECRDSYPEGNQDLGYFGFNPVTREYTAMAIDSMGNTVVTTMRLPEGDTLRFSGRVRILGEDVTLRQTVRKLGGDEYRVSNEELVRGTEWRQLDDYHYRRRAPL